MYYIIGIHYAREYHVLTSKIRFTQSPLGTTLYIVCVIIQFRMTGKKIHEVYIEDPPQLYLNLSINF